MEDQPSVPPPSLHATYAHALLFTGHMIDRPERDPPRFPPSAEGTARAAIRGAVQAIVWERPGTTVGLAGAASGGDLLFHEVCEELGIPTRVLLGLPPDEFIRASVAPAGSVWVRRFHDLLERRGDAGVAVMPPPSGEPPDPGGVWERANAWMLEEALSAADEQALLALWDGMRGDGPGGTEHFLRLAEQRGVRVLEPISLQSLRDR